MALPDLYLNVNFGPLRYKVLSNGQNETSTIRATEDLATVKITRCTDKSGRYGKLPAGYGESFSLIFTTV